ncbi:hypothetical protein NQ315_006038 [Exocentrus adspersus]|uniref:Uncharacterized protein n=1 Tax=Exocentrus adspersus TaxID=1586481 RepID=A0AAV8VGB6_9CUCU|nr:hypothetical protein NQ315_006038 [Exocentrus adspersus]
MNVPEAILKEAASVASSLLPEKSSSRYEREYRDFKNWQQKNGVNGVTEDVLLAYMNQLSARFSPNSLWAKWSMLKSFFRNQGKCTNLWLVSDDLWLLAKIVTIFGIFGCCRCDELLSLAMNDVEDMGKYVIVTLRQTKNLTTRRFTIPDDGCSFQPCTFYRKYEPERYTGHCFRRTGATLVVDAGGDILSLKRAGGWKSSEIAMSYVDDSIR